MGEVTKWWRSKTVNINALYLALVAVVSALGVQMEPELVSALQVILNVVLRAITNKPYVRAG